MLEFSRNAGQQMSTTPRMCQLPPASVEYRPQVSSTPGQVSPTPPFVHYPLQVLTTPRKCRLPLASVDYLLQVLTTPLQVSTTPCKCQLPPASVNYPSASVEYLL